MRPDRHARGQEEGAGSKLGASWILRVMEATQTPHGLGKDACPCDTGNFAPGPLDLI